ncbi:MAG TPA: IS3 family transposase, partial [Firmicutes bacterium]|nr:IS3 family transposase [Bacillota bacterium]
DPVAIFSFVEEEKANHPIATMCRVLGVSTSGYYAWRKRGSSARAREDRELTGLIIEIHRTSRGTYGAPRVHAELAMGFGIKCGRKRVARLMRKAGLCGVHRRRLRGCTRRNPLRPSYPDLVQRDFRATAPNQLWVADITQHVTGEGWLYFAAVIDVFSRTVVGWSMGERPVADLVINAINMAVWNRRPACGLIHHSDHGSQYTSLTFGSRLEEAGIFGSMGRVGDVLDNAVPESFFATLQTELLDRQSWPTRTKLKTAIFEYVEAFYNRHRRHSTLGYLSPAEFERRWYSERLEAVA